jgi:hypothetical protein
MVKHNTRQERIAEELGFGKIIQLASTSTDLVVQQHAAGAIANLAFDNPAMEIRLAREGAVRPLITLASSTCQEVAAIDQLFLRCSLFVHFVFVVCSLFVHLRSFFPHMVVHLVVHFLFMNPPIGCSFVVHLWFIFVHFVYMFFPNSEAFLGWMFKDRRLDLVQIPLSTYGGPSGSMECRK